ncbi:MAG: DinB family protein [Bacteroidetes bacterium]|nr:DinB family protein [Bacteroidota bacterium]
MMNYARMTTLRSVKGLTTEQLDYQFSETSNSIGALLAHIAAVDKWYQVWTFEGRMITEEDMQPIKPAMDLGPLGREKIKGNPLEYYLDELKKVRAKTFEEFSKRDDEWLLKPNKLSDTFTNNYYFDWFHVFEDEINHRGQISLIRKMQHV